MRYVLALDQGTTSSRAIVFDERGAARASAQKEFRQHFLRPGWVEHDAVEILRTQIACARAALKRAKLEPKRLAAIGITNQRETTVVWDRRTGKPVHRAIVWQDRRTAARCEELKKQGLAATIGAKTGLVVDPYFSATKLEWLLDNVSGARAPSAASSLSAPSTPGSRGSSPAASSTSPIRATPRAPCSTISTAVNGTRTSFESSACRARCCPRSCPPLTSTARPRRTCSARSSPSPESPATSRRRSSARPATRRAWRRTRTAPDAFSCSTRATRRSRRATA